MNTPTWLILVGDASMAPYELMATDGSLHIEERSGKPSLECLKLLSDTFPHSVWLNPTPPNQWHYTRTISIIADIFEMYPLSIDGLEKAVAYLKTR